MIAINNHSNKESTSFLPSSSISTSTSSRSGKMIGNAESGTRVWVKESAIDSVRNPRSFKEKMAKKASNLSSTGGGGGSSSSLHSSFARQCSFNSAVGGGGGGSSVASFSSNRDFDNESDFGSVSNNSSSVRQPNRKGGWGWKSGYLTDSSRGGITISLDAVTPETSTTPFTLPANAMSDGDVVMANDYPISTEGNPVCPHDLISLTHLHEPAVVECLHQRYDEDQIYTSTGPVLLALNPFQSIRGLYGESTMKKYWEKAEKNAKGSLPPHVYAIADSAFRSMMRRLDETLGQATPVGCDQSILVSGESGAGKTVTTKFVMKYLAALSQRAGNLPPEKRAFQVVADRRSCQPSVSWNSREEDNDRGLSTVTALSGAGATNSIEAQVLQSNPILESFGNARTVRNDNSSRFGKFIEIQFTRMGRLVGAQIDVYLLEKVRLVTQSLGERNYHIFYELLSGAMNAQELRNYFIASTATPDDFKMTSSGTYDRRDGVSDKDTYRALRTAMNAMKFPQEEQRDIFSTAAAILHASNLNFIPMDQGSALDKENVHLQPVCHLLGVSAEDLSRALCSFSITAGKDTHVQRSLTVEGAIKGLEALMKTTYGALFNYLVTRINDSISFRRDYDSDGEESAEASMVSDNPVACIGVLDIFGFESFNTNSFEQLCINYCNEALQQQFNSFVLKNEQAEYDREGIEWSFIDFPENQDVLDLIDKRGSGILCILDDQCRAPGTSDKSFALDVYNKCKSSSRFSASRKQTATLQFSVNHYAGPVEYTTTGFVEKNRDELPKAATELLQKSFNPFVRVLAETIESNSVERAASATTDTPSKRFRRQDSAMARITVGGQFRKQLKNLRGKIDIMSPHYVRCLKPNDDLIPEHFDRAAVVEQLRCGGILEAVRVARAGYSNHYPHSEFVRRYRCLAWKELSRKETGATYNGGSFGGINQPSSNRKGPRAPGAFRSHNSYMQNTKPPTSASSDSDISSKDLVKILYRKLQQEKDDDNNENENSMNGSDSFQEVTPASPPAQAKKYSFQASTPPPSWSKSSVRSNGLPPAPMTAPSKGFRSSSAAWEKRISDSRPPSSPAVPPRASISKRWGGGTSSDWAKVGIQIGKTKVFLRRTAFETLERLRTKEQSAAAVKLNSMFRMYLARLAYVHVRDTVRHSMHHLQLFESDKECKEQDYGDEYEQNFFRTLKNSFGSASYQGPSLVEVWATQIRSGIHNPVPRHQWGQEVQAKPFKWQLVEGLWIKNHDFEA